MHFSSLCFLSLLSNLLTTLDSCMEREAARLDGMKSSPRSPLLTPVWRERWDDWVRLKAHQPDSGPMVSTLYPVWYNGGSEEPMDGRMGAKVLDSMPASPLSSTGSRGREKADGEIRV